jgi:hypothetical protein
VDLSVYGAFQCNNGRRFEILPATNVGKVAKKIIEVGSKIVVDRESLFDELLASPLKVLKAFRHAMDENAKCGNGRRGKQPSSELCNFQPIPGAGVHDVVPAPTSDSAAGQAPS